LEKTGQKHTRDRVYRKIWEDAYGPIPVDERGVSYDIHHIDGNRHNNALSNLMALSVADHYTLHLKQEDFFEASLIAKRLFIPLEEWKALKSKSTTQQWAKLSKEERSARNKRLAAKIDHAAKNKKRAQTMRDRGQKLKQWTTTFPRFSCRSCQRVLGSNSQWQHFSKCH